MSDPTTRTPSETTFEGSNGKDSSTLKPIRPFALRMARRLVGCFPLDWVADPEVYLLAIAQNLNDFSDQVITKVCDPTIGLPATCSVRLTVNVVRSACSHQREVWSREPSAYQKGWSETAQKQIEERRQDEERNPAARARREFYESGKISDYLASGGPVPGPGRPHLGRGEASPAPDRKPVGNYPTPDKLKPVVWDDRLKGDLDRLLAVPSLQGRR